MHAAALLLAVLLCPCGSVASSSRPALVIRGGGAAADSRELVAENRDVTELFEQPAPPPPKRRRVQLPRLTPGAQIVVNLVLWWALNVVFNLSNKQCLNSWPHPWALAVLHLAIG